MYTNIDSILNKRNELKTLVNTHTPDIIVITEIKPKRYRYCIQPCEVELNGYDLFHNLDEEGRGVCIYTSKLLKATICEQFDVKSSRETILIECKLNGLDKLLIGGFYRSPNSNNENNENLNKLIHNIGNSAYSHILLMGDFNYKEINWSDEVCNAALSNPAHKFLDCIKDVYLTQNQLGTTRHRENQSDSLLDLIFTNEDKMIDEIYTLAGIGKSDHVTLLFDFKCYSVFKTPKQAIVMYNNGNYDAMRSEVGGKNGKTY